MRNKPCRSVIPLICHAERSSSGAVASSRRRADSKQAQANLPEPERGWTAWDCCIVLVDAGYLLGAAASLLAGEPSRSRITVDDAALIQGLRERAESDTERPPPRIYWFDAPPTAYRNPEHRRLRVMPRVTVRLGALTRSDGRWAQRVSTPPCTPS